MIDSVLNHMDADELRNLVIHLQEVVEAKGQLIFAESEMIECFHSLYNNQNYREESRIRLNAKVGSLREVERKLEEKYKEYMPVPVCDSEAVSD